MIIHRGQATAAPGMWTDSTGTATRTCKPKMIPANRNSFHGRDTAALLVLCSAARQIESVNRPHGTMLPYRYE